MGIKLAALMEVFVLPMPEPVSMQAAAAVKRSARKALESLTSKHLLRREGWRSGGNAAALPPD